MKKEKQGEPDPAGGSLTRQVSLSGRLTAIVEMAGSGDCVCDVGCDHAHVPIRLLQEGRYARAIGMDVIEGPLGKAAGNLALYGMADRVQLRKSDGLDAFLPGEADTLVITGMGGTLMREILLREPEKTSSFRTLVLGPQSDPDKVRAALRHLGARIEAERLLYEDGKYYPVLRAVFRAEPENMEAEPENKEANPEKEEAGPVENALEPAKNGVDPEKNGEDPAKNAFPPGDREGKERTETAQRQNGSLSITGFPPEVPEEIRQEAADLFGPVLLENRDPVLLEYLTRQTAVLEKILGSVTRAADSDTGLRQKHLARRQEILHSLEVFRAALAVCRHGGDNEA